VSVCSFLTSTWYDPPTKATYSVAQLAEWVSYQSFRSKEYGDVPVNLVLTQWGIETSWGGTDWYPYYNPGQQGSTCGYGSQCGTEPIGYPIYCSIGQGVQSYADLLVNGYPHVATAYAYGGVSWAASALGKGYFTEEAVTSTFCGWSGPINSSHPRIWAGGEYNDGGGAGSSITDTINANSCLQSYGFVQVTNPIPAFPSK
jgi:hypothetical protein